MKMSLTLLILAASLSAAPAFAQSWYFGLGVGSGNLDVSGQDLTGLANASVSDNATTYTVRLGYRFNPYLALEGGYYDLGDYEFSGGLGPTQVTGQAKAKSFGLSVVGILPVSSAFELYGRVGIEESETKLSVNVGQLASGKTSEKDTGATYGVGARYMFSPSIGVFAEWMRNDKIEVDSYLAGVDFRF